MLLKIAPDLADAQVDEAVDIAREQGASGLIVANTTVSRRALRTPAVGEMGDGGVSGAPLLPRALALGAARVSPNGGAAANHRRGRRVRRA